MITNLNNKFKDRSPEDTVKKIEDFFSKTIFDLKEEVFMSNEAGTWSCRYSLSYKGQNFLGQNGKGVTKEYAKASGLAELYERFCNYFILNSTNPIFSNLYQELNQKKNNYYFSKDEKKLTKEEIYSFDFIKEYLNNIAGNCSDIFLDLITEKNPIGIPYQNITNEKDIKYFDPRILSRIKTSQGMAAGNSKEEALVQGISEILEIYAANCFYEEPQDKYYFFTKEDVKNKELYNIIDNIEKANNQSIYFFDLSYNFKVPVIASFLINHINCNIVMNFGCFPIFDIALERSLTELYQGVDSQQNYMLYQPLEPYKTKKLSDLWRRSLGCLARNGCFNEQLFSCLERREFNKEIFLSAEEFSNVDLLQKIISIGKNNNFNFYYRDNSLSKDLYALDILCDTINMGKGWIDLTKEYSQEDKALCVLSGIKRREFAEECINNENINLNNYEMFNDLIDLIQVSNCLVIHGWPGFYCGQSEYDLDALLSIFIKENYIDENYLKFSNFSLYYKYFTYFNLLRKYKNTKLYTDKEIFDFMKVIYPETSYKDIFNCYNKNYVFNNAFLKPFKDTYWNILPQVINTLIPGNLE